MRSPDSGTFRLLCRLRAFARRCRACRLLLLVLLWQGPLLWIDYHGASATEMNSNALSFDVSLAAHLRRFHTGGSDAGQHPIGWHFHVTMPEDDGDPRSNDPRHDTSPTDSRHRLADFDRNGSPSATAEMGVLLGEIAEQYHHRAGHWDTSLLNLGRRAEADCLTLRLARQVDERGNLPASGFVGSLACQRSLPTLLGIIRC